MNAADHAPPPECDRRPLSFNRHQLTCHKCANARVCALVAREVFAKVQSNPHAVNNLGSRFYALKRAAESADGEWEGGSSGLSVAEINKLAGGIGTAPLPGATTVTTPPASTIAAGTPALRTTLAYHFPVVGRLGGTDQELLQQLRDWMKSPSPDYSTIRDALCAVQIELNLRGLTAPAFRPRRPVPPKAITVDERLEMLDRQVIDLHWRAQSADKPLSSVLGYEGIFDREPFDFSIAERFAVKAWRSDAKVNHLHLSEAMQLEHASLRSQSVRKLVEATLKGEVCGSKVIRVGMPQIEQKLRTSGTRLPTPKSEADLKGMLALWAARRLLTASATLTQIARLSGLISGRPARDASAVGRSLKALDSRLDKAI